MIPANPSASDDQRLDYEDSANLEPDPARSYERAKPLKECGEDRLDRAAAPPWAHPDEMLRAVHNAHDSHQLNNDSGCDAGASNPL